MTPRTYFGPCRAGLHPEFGWGKPCLNDASEYVEIHTEGVEWSKTSLMRLCTEHADQAEQRDGFHSRRPLTVPYEPPVVTL